MIRSAVLAALASMMPLAASAETFTVLTPKGGMAEHSRSVVSGELHRSVDRTGPNGRTTGKDVEVRRNGDGTATRSVTHTGPNGGSATRIQVIGRN